MQYQEIVKKIGLTLDYEIKDNYVIWTSGDDLIVRSPYHKLIIKFEKDEVVVCTVRIGGYSVESGNKRFDRSVNYTPLIRDFLKGSPFFKG